MKLQRLHGTPANPRAPAAPARPATAGLRKWLGQLPSAMFEKSGVRKYGLCIA